MILAKTCYASNMMQGFKKQLTRLLKLQKLSAKYYLNWFLFHIVYHENQNGVNFF